MVMIDAFLACNVSIDFPYETTKFRYENAPGRCESRDGKGCWNDIRLFRACRVSELNRECRGIGL